MLSLLCGQYHACHPHLSGYFPKTQSRQPDLGVQVRGSILPQCNYGFVSRQIACERSSPCVTVTSRGLDKIGRKCWMVWQGGMQGDRHRSLSLIARSRSLWKNVVVCTAQHSKLRDTFSFFVCCCYTLLTTHQFCCHDELNHLFGVPLWFWRACALESAASISFLAYNNQDSHKLHNMTIIFINIIFTQEVH